MNSDHFGRHVPVPSFQQAPPELLTPKSGAVGYGSTGPNVIVPPVQPDAVTSPPKRAYTPLLPDLSKYDLTVGEALDVFVAQNRKVPSIRSLQRYCQDGRFDCYKLKTTRNGNPVHEWIINSTSLLSFIQTKPEDTASEPVASPEQIGDVETSTEPPTAIEIPSSVTASPERSVDAKPNFELPRTSDTQPDDKTTPEQSDDASGATTSRVALMVENAKLTARLDSQDDLIGELREDKKFMREQIVHQRGNDTLMADMHRETLHTLKAVSVAGRHTKIEMGDTVNSDEKGSAFRDITDDEQPPQNDRFDGV